MVPIYCGGARDYAATPSRAPGHAGCRTKARTETAGECVSMFCLQSFGTTPIFENFFLAKCALFESSFFDPLASFHDAR